MGKQCQTLFFGTPKSLQMVTAAMKLKDAYSSEGVMTNLDSILKQRYYFAHNGPSSQGCGFSSGLYGCESWTVRIAEH